MNLLNHNPKRSESGYSLVEVLIASLIIAVGCLALYSSVLWGRYRATQSQYVVSAAAIGKHQMEVIKALGISNGTDTSYNVLNISSTFYNPHLAYGGNFARSNAYSTDTSYDVESLYVDDTTYGTSKVIRIFTVHVYLHPSNTSDTSSAPFNTPLATYVTYVSPGGI